MNGAVWPLLAATLCGCATVKVGGFTLGQGRWDSDAAVVKKRAAFEMQCPEPQLELTVLAVYSGTITAQQVGVTGCGQRLVYVNSSSYYNDGWKLDPAKGQCPGPHDAVAK